MLSSRAVALQGVGFSPALLALQGLVPREAIPVAPNVGGFGAGRQNKAWPKKRKRQPDDWLLLGPPPEI